MSTLTLERVMSVEELREIEASLLQELRSAGEPVRPSVLIESLGKGPRRYSPSIVRRAIWHLVSLGEIAFTSDLNLQVSHQA